MVHLKKTAMILFAALLCHVPAAASAADGGRGGAFGIEDWLSSASAKWQISFLHTTRFATPGPGIPAGTPGKVESQLDFEGFDSPIVIVTGGARITPTISFDAAFGTAPIFGGRGRDTDRFIPDGGPAFTFSESRNDLSGDVRLWSVNFYYNNARYTDDRRKTWGLLVGFLHYEDDLVMRNGLQTVSRPFDSSTPSIVPIGPLAGLNSTYDFAWDALKAGVMRRAFLSERLAYEGEADVYPFAMYRGEGFWNLRAGNDPTDFQPAPPSFIHRSTSGYGYEAALGLVYELSDNFELSAGYRYLHLYTSGGSDTTFLADGSILVSDLDWVSVTRQGTYAGILFRF